MTVFDSLFAEAAAPELLAQFGESVVYVPKGGTPRTIALAIVDRNPPEALVGPASGHGPMLLVTVEDHATRGILKTELNTGGDRIEVAVRKGGAAKSMQINKLVKDTGGMLTIEIR